MYDVFLLKKSVEPSLLKHLVKLFTIPLFEYVRGEICFSKKREKFLYECINVK